MKTIKEFLHEADPFRGEPEIPSSRRDASRQAVIAAAFGARRGMVSASFRFARFAIVSVVAIGILFLGSRVWPLIVFETHAAVRFEVRLAEDAPAPGLREAKVSGSDRVIYLHEEVVLGNVDIAQAEVVAGGNVSEFIVSLRFTPDGARRMREATQNHIGKPVAILVDDEVVMAPTLRSAIGESAQIDGNFTREQAERIVNGI